MPMLFPPDGLGIGAGGGAPIGAGGIGGPPDWMRASSERLS